MIDYVESVLSRIALVAAIAAAGAVFLNTLYLIRERREIKRMLKKLRERKLCAPKH